MIDILLTTGGDLIIGETGDISITDSVRQAIRIRLRWFFKEWRLGKKYGIPYYEEVFVKNPNELRIRQIFRDEIMTVEEVKEAKVITINIDKQMRTASIRYQAIVDKEVFGEEVLINV